MRGTAPARSRRGAHISPLPPPGKSAAPHMSEIAKNSESFVDGVKAAAPAMLAVTAMRSGEREHIGSAYLLNTAEGAIAVTAAHVLRDELDVELWGPTGRVSLNGHQVCEVKGGTTVSPADVAWVHLEPHEANELGSAGLAFSDASLHAPRPGESTVMLGLPISKSGAPRGVLEGKMMFGTGEVLDASDLPDTCDGSFHVPVSFNRKRVRDLQGHEMTAPWPAGMSGGPALIVYQQGAQTHVTAIGVLIEYHEKRRQKCFVITPLRRVFSGSVETACR